MLLATFKNNGPIPGHDDKLKTGISGRRWALEVANWEIGLYHQCFSCDRWNNGIGYYAVGLCRRLSIGFYSDYNNGQHYWDPSDELMIEIELKLGFDNPSQL